MEQRSVFESEKKKSKPNFLKSYKLDSENFPMQDYEHVKYQPEILARYKTFYVDETADWKYFFNEFPFTPS